jgi:hypothetical protein
MTNVMIKVQAKTKVELVMQKQKFRSLKIWIEAIVSSQISLTQKEIKNQ